MAKMIGLARVGRDAELRSLPNGDAVINVALAFSYGKKGQDGNRPTQWCEGAMFGKRAEQIAPFILKGNQVVAYLSDIRIETYEGKNGTGSKLVGRLDDIELTDRKDGGQAARPAPQPVRQAPPPKPTHQAPDASSDDDIPF